jgi:type IV pilus assembly protein PilV
MKREKSGQAGFSLIELLVAVNDSERSDTMKPSNKQAGNESGFTLIEVLIALTIFAIGLLALASMQITGIQGNAKAHEVTAKSALAMGVLEQINALEGNDDFFQNDITDMIWTFSGADSIELAGAGTCSALVSITVDPTINGTTYVQLTQASVTVTCGNGPSITQTLIKKRRD